MGQQYSHLSSEERILIEKLHCEQHLSIRRTAERIGRDKSTVSRELRRGQRRIERTRGPRPGLQPFRPVGTVRPVLVGREPQAAPQLA